MRAIAKEKASMGRGEEVQERRRQEDAGISECRGWPTSI